MRTPRGWRSGCWGSTRTGPPAPTSSGPSWPPPSSTALVYRRPDNAALTRASPEWCWRDFRLRLGHGRNHLSDQRLERAALVWALYRNFTPAQDRSERKRTYRHPGRCPLTVAGSPPAGASYLDALAL